MQRKEWESGTDEIRLARMLQTSILVEKRAGMSRRIRIWIVNKVGREGGEKGGIWELRKQEEELDGFDCTLLVNVWMRKNI
jgi:hypothetical protein